MKGLEKGYTTVELVVVFAIVSILVFLAVYNPADRMPHQRLKEAGQNLVGQLRLARQKAIADGLNATFSFNPELREYNHPVLGKRTLPDDVDFGTPVGMTKAQNDGLTVPEDGVAFSSNKATFQPDGTVIGGGSGSVYLKNATEAVAIRVNVTGRVKLLWWNGNAWE